MTRQFLPLLPEARAARRFVTSTMACWDLTVEHVDLVASELATNAILHGRTPFEVEVSEVPTGARIGVADRNSRPPASPGQDPGALSGRGLYMVGQLALDWGVELSERGKTVWAVLPYV